MRNMKKIVAWILGLVMLLGLGLAAAETTNTLPEIPTFEGTLNVRPIGSEAEAIEYAKEFWALDYMGMDLSDAIFVAEPWEEGTWIVYAMDSADEGAYCFGDVAFDFNGNVILAENASSGVFEVLNESGESEASMDAEILFSATEDDMVTWRENLDRKVQYPFLAEVNPQLYEEYTGLYPIEEGNNEFLTHYNNTFVDSYDNSNIFDLNYSEQFMEETFCIKYVIQTSPVVRVVYFDAYTDAEEGGNG